AASEFIPMSIDTLCDWGERTLPTLLQLQVGRGYTIRHSCSGWAAFFVHKRKSRLQSSAM
ncbi:hypothetical protein, partial [Vibrio cholerae]|uniref:hypothetical protein n=1 Tax=Vibrio cholerae TaxID=666 RepID=UPI001E2ABF1D